MTNAYYNALLVLKDLTPIVALADIRRQSDADFKAITRSHNCISVFTVDEMANDFLEIEDFNEGVGVLCDAPPGDVVSIPSGIAGGIAPASAGGADGALMPVVAVDLTEESRTFDLPDLPIFKINFDNYVHHSGERRAFAYCPNKRHKSGSVRCRRYKFIKDFPSLDDAALWLAAWTWAGRDEPNEVAHIAFNPVDSDIERMKAAMIS